MQQLEQKIRQLVPSLQENPWTSIVQAGIEDIKECQDDNYTQFLTEQIQRAEEMEKEFMGIEIQLHHVLQAIALTIGDEYAWEQAIDTTGQFRTDWGDKRHEGSGIYWDLTLPLSGQSEEVVKFLNEVLN